MVHDDLAVLRPAHVQLHHVRAQRGGVLEGGDAVARTVGGRAPVSHADRGICLAVGDDRDLQRCRCAALRGDADLCRAQAHARKHAVVADADDFGTVAGVGVEAERALRLDGKLQRAQLAQAQGQRAVKADALRRGQHLQLHFGAQAVVGACDELRVTALQSGHAAILVHLRQLRVGDGIAECCAAALVDGKFGLKLQALAHAELRGGGMQLRGRGADAQPCSGGLVVVGRCADDDLALPQRAQQAALLHGDHLRVAAVQAVAAAAGDADLCELGLSDAERGHGQAERNLRGRLLHDHPAVGAQSAAGGDRHGGAAHAHTGDCAAPGVNPDAAGVGAAPAQLPGEACGRELTELAAGYDFAHADGEDVGAQGDGFRAGADFLGNFLRIGRMSCGRCVGGREIEDRKKRFVRSPFIRGKAQLSRRSEEQQQRQSRRQKPANAVFHPQFTPRI